MPYRDDMRQQLEELRSEAYRLANSIEGLRQAHELATPGSVRDSIQLAATNCELAARFLNRARVELAERAKVLGTHKIINIDDVGKAIERDAQAFPVCVRCERPTEECNCQEAA